MYLPTHLPFQDAQYLKSIDFHPPAIFKGQYWYNGLGVLHRTLSEDCSINLETGTQMFFGGTVTPLMVYAPTLQEAVRFLLERSKKSDTIIGGLTDENFALLNQKK